MTDRVELPPLYAPIGFIGIHDKSFPRMGVSRMTDREELRIRVAAAIRAAYAQSLTNLPNIEEYVGEVDEWLGEADAAIHVILGESW
jgi:hypothetical protein